MTIFIVIKYLLYHAANQILILYRPHIAKPQICYHANRLVAANVTSREDEEQRAKKHHSQYESKDLFNFFIYVHAPYSHGGHFPFMPQCWDNVMLLCSRLKDV